MKHCCIWSVFGWTQPNICMHEQMLGVMGHSNGDYTSELSLGSWVPCPRHPTTFLWSSVWLHRKVWKSGCLESVMWRENCTDCLNSNSLRPILKCFHLQAVLKRMANRARVELLFSKIRYKKKKWIPCLSVADYLSVWKVMFRVEAWGLFLCFWETKHLKLSQAELSLFQIIWHFFVKCSWLQRKHSLTWSSLRVIVHSTSVSVFQVLFLFGVSVL